MRLVPTNCIATMQKGTAVEQQSGIEAGQNQSARVEVTASARATLWSLAVEAGLQVLQQLLEQDRVAICGPRYRHQATRQAGRAGTVPSAVVLGGRKVTVARPRVRAGGREVALPTFQAVARTDVLSARVVEQLLVGVATRQYGRSLDPLPVGIGSRSTSKSAVSRRFVAQTRAQFEAWQTRSLAAVDLAALFVDGVQLAHHAVVVALGVDVDGRKQVLGLWEGGTENASVCQSLLANLQERGLRTDRSLLIILDGSKALAKAVRAMWGAAAWIQRCQVHKQRNVLAHAPKGLHAEIRTGLRRAYRAPEVGRAKRLLLALADRLEARAPAAATSLREGVDETLTVLELDLSDRLRRSLATTNPIESLMSRVRATHRRVTRWRNPLMMVRWVAAGLREAERGFHRLFGANEIGVLVRALRRRDEQLGLKAARVAA